MQNGSPESTESKKYIFRPIRITYIGRFGRKFGQKIYCLDSLGPGDPFCTLKRLHNSFCGFCESRWSYAIFGQNRSLSQAFEGAKYVSWAQRIRKLYFPAKSADISDSISDRFGRDRTEIYIFWILWTQETHFAPSITFITHFATILSSIKD